MKRRKFIQALAALPAATMPIPLLGQSQSTQRQGNGASSSVGQTPPPGQSAPVLKTVTASDAAVSPVPAFFTEQQLSALRRLSGLFIPPLDGKPGALDCEAPEFLDFYVGASSVAHQQFYRSGLDDLNSQAKSKFNKTFAALSDAEADSIVKPMFKPRGPLQAWLELGPFANRAYQDLWTATVNSPAWAAHDKAAGVRAITPLYWKRVDPTIVLTAAATPKKKVVE
jgi:hypothetical protein